MDFITYDEDGNPISVPEARKPPRRVSRQAAVETNLTGIFEIEGASYDVVLENSRLEWTPVSLSAKGSRTKKSKASIMKKLRGVKSLDRPRSSTSDTDNGLHFRDILGVKIRRYREKAPCQGIDIYVHDRKEPNRYKERTLLLGHPSEEICVAWIKKIEQGLEDFSERPKKIKVFLQPHAGKKQGKNIYNLKVKPLFEVAGITTEVTEVEHNEHIKQQFIHMSLSDFDSVVCVGGDGTVHKVMNGLLCKVQQDECSDMRMGQPVHRSPLPLGIIPTGLVNQIAHSIHGIEDPITAAMHIILGHKKPVNVCAIYHKDKLHRWAFNASYGFFGNVVPFLGRHSSMGEKKVEYAILKALTKKRFRSYEADIQYIDAGEYAGKVTKGSTCTTGCSVCEVDALGLSQLSTYSDEVQELDPLTASSTSSTIIERWWGTCKDPLSISSTGGAFGDLSKEVPWKSIKGEFINVGLFSLPGLCDLSPRGVSPYTHVNDGYMDLIIIQPTERKEFIRYLKRQGNAKNQFDFPFVETYRCKEINFHIRLKETWNHKDYGFSEIDYEMERQGLQHKPGAITRSKSIDVIEEICMEYSDDEDENTEEINDSNEDDDDLSQRGEGSQGATSPTGSAQNQQRSSYRPTYQEMDRARRQRKQQKKDEKKKAEAEASMRSLWNLDNEACLELDLEFRVHQNLLCIYGQGVSDDTEYEETKYSCLAMMK